MSRRNLVTWPTVASRYLLQEKFLRAIAAGPRSYRDWRATSSVSVSGIDVGRKIDLNSRTNEGQRFRTGVPHVERRERSAEFLENESSLESSKFGSRISGCKQNHCLSLPSIVDTFPRVGRIVPRACHRFPPRPTFKPAAYVNSFHLLFLRTVTDAARYDRKEGSDEYSNRACDYLGRKRLPRWSRVALPSVRCRGKSSFSRYHAMAARLPPGVPASFGERTREGVALAHFSTLFERNARALLPPIERLFHRPSYPFSSKKHPPFPPTFAFHPR